MYRLLILLMLCNVAYAQTFSCGSGDTEWSAGLTWSDGIEPGDASVCPTGYTCHYVDCDAVTDGTGTYASPYWGFETVLGYTSGGSYYEGVVSRTNDSKQIIYIKGTCDYGTSVNSATGPLKQIIEWRAVGEEGNPVIIKSYPGVTQAVFDGEGTGEDAFYFKNTTGTDGGFFIENIRITDWTLDGIKVEDFFEYFEVHSVTIDNIDGDGVGTVGPIIIFQRDTDSKQTALIRNCYFHTNDQNVAGGINNRGTIRHHGVWNAFSTSTFTAQNNVIDGGAYCFQDKHFGGNVLIKESICKNATGMAFIRADSFEIDKVVFDSINRVDPADGTSVYGIVLDDENIQLGYKVTGNIHNSTIYNLTQRLVSTSLDYADDIQVTFESNIVDDSTYTGRPMYIAQYGSDSVDLNDITFGGNVYNISSTTQSGFGWYQNAGYSFSAWNAIFGDTTSTVSDPELVDPANDDFDSDLSIGACVLSAVPVDDAAISTMTGGSHILILDQLKRRRYR